MDDTPLRRRLGLDQQVATPVKPPTETSWDQPETDDDSEPLRTGSVRNVVKELLETAIFILLIFFIVRGIVQNFKIEGSSMEPSLHSGQYVLVNKLIYFHFDINAPQRLLPGNDDLPAQVVYPFRMPERGDVIVLEFPRDVSKDYIKRVIGLPGETVEVRDGVVYINNEPLDEPYLQGMLTNCSPGSACAQGPIVVPPDSIFVMGDNRSNSSDSREWGVLPLQHVIGQAWLLYYPVQDWGIIDHPSYAADSS